MSDNLGQLLKRAISSQNHQDFAKLITAIEVQGPKSLKTAGLLAPDRHSYRLGITGPPGSGKSSLISSLLKKYSRTKLKIGVVAVDPTSPFSNGAILGDRIRYSEEAVGPNVFIRSIGTRGSLGGLSSAVYLMLRAFDACGFDLVFVETVGVGQVEVEVMNVADQVVLVLVPESGDSVQAMKAGVIEMANLIVVNKSDRPGADSLRRELEAQIHLLENSAVEVLSTTATRDEGVAELYLKLETLRTKEIVRSKRDSKERLQAEAFALKRQYIEEQAMRSIRAVKTPQDLKKLF